MRFPLSARVCVSVNVFFFPPLRDHIENYVASGEIVVKNKCSIPALAHAHAFLCGGSPSAAHETAQQLHGHVIVHACALIVTSYKYRTTVDM